MAETHLTLLMPQLFDRCQNDDTTGLQFLPLLLSRSFCNSRSPNELESILFQLFNFNKVADGSLPIAAVTGLADGLDTRQGYWLRVDPVEFRADLAAIYLLGNQHLVNDLQKLAPFINEFSKMLSQEKILLYTPDSKRWYLQTEQNPQITTSMLDQVIGKDIGRFQPLGNQAIYWQKLLTEMQMLLYTYGYGQNDKIMNGFWLWGEGSLPLAITARWDNVWSDEPVAKGLSLLASNPTHELPQSFLDYKKLLKNSRHNLLVISALESSSLVSLDTVWFKPMVQALKDKSLTSLDMYCGNGAVYSVTSRSIAYFWRRPRLVFSKYTDKKT